MSETPAHRRAKRRAAGPGGRTEVPLRGNQRLDALSKGGGRATEVERSGSSAGLNSAAQRLKKSGAPGKVLQVPQKDMGGAVTMCGLLGVSTSGYYAWQGRAPSARAQSDGAMLDRIRDIHRTSRGTYGAPRVHAELVAQGHAVGRKRIARLMRRAGLRGISRRKGTRTTVRDARTRAAPDLVERDFTADAPDRLWVADITYIPTWAGFLYLAVVLDAFSRRVVGWSMANHLRTQLVLDALDMALWQRRPDGVRPSTGSVGDCYDNAMCESFFATLECELLERRRFRSHAEARMAVFEFIEGWYNPRRRHSAIGYLSPVNYERSQLPPLAQIHDRPRNRGNSTCPAHCRRRTSTATQCW